MNLSTTSLSGTVGCCEALAAAGAHADQRDDESRACGEDAFKLCSSKIPDEDKVVTCMKRHVSELSPQHRVYFVAKKTSGSFMACIGLTDKIVAERNECSRAGMRIFFE
ncbi:hypothetical protein [Pararobbsia alpina]|uniref:hypothetical protein n=1 Tax=Pararobbsia alpina TaxID=621374 RepID=UPI0039A5901F